MNEMMEQVAGKLERVTWHGRYFSAKCIYHDDNSPSLLVYEDGAYCLGCQKKVSLKALWKRVSGQKEVVRETPGRMFDWNAYGSLEALADTAHETLINYRQTFGRYLDDRGIGSCITSNWLGWERGWYTVPLFSRLREFTGLIIRASPAIQAAYRIRYLFPPGQAPTLYVPNWNRIKDYAYVVFGIIDALAFSALGFPVVTSTHGQNFPAHLLDDLRIPLTIIPDRGEETMARRLVSNLGWRGRLHLLNYPEGCKDPADYVKYNQTRNLPILLPR